ncbi:cellulose synthase/poly-beta-1,6-N-acetylglucosamine synthase-like glycosyltransferase, partial [Actinoplanes lutulentus]
MSWANSWLIAITGYAILLAWPISTLVLVWFAVRYNGTHRAKVINKAVAGGDGRPQHFWVIVPALNEEAVVANTVNAALRLRGPAGTLARVLVVDDGSDDRTPEVLSAIDHPRLSVMRRELPNARQGKGEALNAAYRFISERTAEAGVSPERV